MLCSSCLRCGVIYIHDEPTSDGNQLCPSCVIEVTRQRETERIRKEATAAKEPPALLSRIAVALERIADALEEYVNQR